MPCRAFVCVRGVHREFEDLLSVLILGMNLTDKLEFTDALLYKISFLMSEAPSVAPGAIVIVALPV